MLSLFTGMTGRMHGHPELQENETVLHACYGLGAQIVAFANRSVSRLSTTWEGPESGSQGLASPINRSGVLALTNQRLLFFQKRFSIGIPKNLKRSWPLDQITNVTFADNNLVVEFSDGSTASLHVPPMQKPKLFVDRFADQSNAD